MTDAPVAWLGRYVTGRGTYPRSIAIANRNGSIRIRLWSHHDLLTVNEIFFRQDYRAKGDETTIVDFGSNVGISASYFLHAAPAAKVYLFEPLDANVDRLREQLADVTARYELQQVAVGTADGPVTFGVEPTGRYGGIAKNVGQFITVPCRNANVVLEEILKDRGAIDLLKIDIEGSEKPVVAGLRSDIAARIATIYAEATFEENPLAATHDWHQSVGIATFTRKRSMPNAVNQDDDEAGTRRGAG